MNESANRLAMLWILTIIGMVLHFNYQVSGIFYGIELLRPGASGKEPASVFVIRTLFYHLPMIWVVCILYVRAKWAFIVLFILSILYSLAHLGHFIGEVSESEKNYSQLSLLFVVLFISLLLTIEHYKMIRKAG